MSEEQVMNQEEELSNEVQDVNYSGLSDDEFLKLSEPDKDEGVMMSETPINSGSEDNFSNMSQEVGDNSLNSGSDISDEEFRRRITGNFNFNGRNVSINNPDVFLSISLISIFIVSFIISYCISIDAACCIFLYRNKFGI